MFLDKIIERTKIRVEQKKGNVSISTLIAQVERLSIDFTFPFEESLKRKDLSFICEVKKASPSKGLISSDFPYIQIAKEYEAAGADAISVLTEPDFFMGEDEYLSQISSIVKIPTLRKDFVIDPYQIYEAKLLGAQAVLLISEILELDILTKYIDIAHSIGLSALVESHSLNQLDKALSAGARVLGINNRNLETFEVDLNTSLILRNQVPKEKILISESGIVTSSDIKILKENGFNGVLIGETLMRSSDRKQDLEKLRGKA